MCRVSIHWHQKTALLFLLVHEQSWIQASFDPRSVCLSLLSQQTGQGPAGGAALRYPGLPGLRLRGHTRAGPGWDGSYPGWELPGSAPRAQPRRPEQLCKSTARCFSPGAPSAYVRGSLLPIGSIPANAENTSAVFKYRNNTLSVRLQILRHFKEKLPED